MDQGFQLAGSRSVLSVRGRICLERPEKQFEALVFGTANLDLPEHWPLPCAYPGRLGWQEIWGILRCNNFHMFHGININDIINLAVS